MSTGSFDRVANASNFEQLLSSFGSIGSQELKLLWDLAQELEASELLRSAGMVYELTRLAAKQHGDERIAADASPRAKFLLGFQQYHFHGEVEFAVQALTTSAEEFSKLGELDRAVAALVAGSRIALRNDRADVAINTANRALALLAVGDGAYDSLASVHLLAREMFQRASGFAPAVFYAYASEVFRNSGESELADCTAALLGCALIRHGDLESGLEVLDEVGRSLRRYSAQLADGKFKPLSEAFLAEYSDCPRPRAVGTVE